MYSSKSLYESTVLYIVKHIELYTFNVPRHDNKVQQICNQHMMSFSQLTPSMRFDIIWELFKSTTNNASSKKTLVLLEQILQDIDTVFELLQMGHHRMKLHVLFEDLQRAKTIARDEVTSSDDSLAHKISTAFVTRTRQTTASIGLHNFGHNLAAFLSDGGWYMAAESVLVAIKEDIDEALLAQIDEMGTTYNLCQRLKLETCTKLLHVYSEYRHFVLADEIFTNICEKKLKNNDFSILEPDLNLSAVYCEFSNYCYSKSQYREAYDWGLKAVMNLTTEIPARVVIDILRQAGKASVLRRQFPKAEILLREALLRARDVYGENHLKYADCLVDYAFYLLNVDGVVKSVQAYEKALTVREKILGKENLLVARAYEELAYATYVNEYNSGQFKTAKFYADTSLTIMQKIIPSNHLLMASSQRVLALILEEIAIDLNDKKQSTEMLNQAEQLHLSAVSLSSSAFGEMNVQTAKHYGNLGRLYQTMEKFDQAEQMHLKAIHIKETLLGKDDYEVALSIGHLASLYNYDLEEFIKAEELYLRSIAISLRLFGPAYSGLEYDYRGLVRVYELSTDWENVYKYISKLADWKDLRRAKETDSNHELFYTTTTARIPLTKILQSITSTNSSSFTKSNSENTSSMMMNST